LSHQRVGRWRLSFVRSTAGGEVEVRYVAGSDSCSDGITAFELTVTEAKGTVSVEA